MLSWGELLRSGRAGGVDKASSSDALGSRLELGSIFINIHLYFEPLSDTRHTSLLERTRGLRLGVRKKCFGRHKLIMCTNIKLLVMEVYVQKEMFSEQEVQQL